MALVSAGIALILAAAQVTDFSREQLRFQHPCKPTGVSYDTVVGAHFIYPLQLLSFTAHGTRTEAFQAGFSLKTLALQDEPWTDIQPQHNGFVWCSHVEDRGHVSQFFVLDPDTMSVLPVRLLVPQEDEDGKPTALPIRDYDQFYTADGGRWTFVKAPGSPVPFLAPVGGETWPPVPAEMLAKYCAIPEWFSPLDVIPSGSTAPLLLKPNKPLPLPHTLLTSTTASTQQAREPTPRWPRRVASRRL